MSASANLAITVKRVNAKVVPMTVITMVFVIKPHARATVTSPDCIASTQLDVQMAAANMASVETTLATATMDGLAGLAI